MDKYSINVCRIRSGYLSTDIADTYRMSDPDAMYVCIKERELGPWHAVVAQTEHRFKLANIFHHFMITTGTLVIIIIIIVFFF